MSGKWTKETALEELDAIISNTRRLEAGRAFSEEHVRWMARAQDILDEVFGSGSKYSRSFNQFTWQETGSFVLRGFDIQEQISRRHHTAYVQQLGAARGLLLAARDRLERSEIEDLREGASEDVVRPLTAANRIFLGHGRSLVWLELRDFLEKRLKLLTDEFNRESVAGVHTADRLEQMLTDACFAFLVLTAEDERPDGSLHARENVIHEVGLFQGRLGFQRAIILLEEGCAQFSNIHGLTHIPFAKGRVGTAFEQIRLVLERERILPTSAKATE